MYTFTLNAKLVSETRTDKLDISSLLGPTDTLTSASATCAVYSGIDGAPSSVVGACTIDAVYNLVNLPLTGGIAGCIYQLVITVVVTSGNKYMTGFLVVTPDAV